VPGNGRSGTHTAMANNIEGWDGDHRYYFTKASFQKLFRDEGFKVVNITNSGIFTRPRKIRGSLLGVDIVVVGVKE